MRDRLIELLRQKEFDYYEECQVAFEDGYKSAPDFAEFFANHLLAEGVIVPKVKIDDKLYVLNVSKTKIFEFTVTFFEVYKSDINIWGAKKDCCSDEFLCRQSNIANNEWVYLTRDEAEKALAERSENGKS